MDTRDDDRPRDTDPSDMTDFEKNVAYGELEQLEQENDAARPEPEGRARRDDGYASRT